MRRLLAIEWLKISKYRTMVWLLGGYVALLVLIFASFSEITIGPFELFSSASFKFPYTWQNVSYLGKFLNFYLCIAIIFMVTNEYSYRTVRQHVIDGLSRSEVVLSKIGVIAIMSLVSTLLLAVVGFILGFRHSTVVSFTLVTDRIDFLVAHFIHLFTLLSLAMLLAFLLKKNGLTVILFLTYVVFGEAIIRNLLPGDFTQYFPVKTLTNLNLYPSIEAIQKEFNFGSTSVPVINIVLGLAYGFLFQLASFLKIRSADL